MREEENGQTKDLMLSVKNRVMDNIKEKKIKMKRPWVFAVEKFGLESAVMVALICATLLVSLIFYFFKTTALFEYLALGPLGVRVFFGALPYNYIVLFVLIVLIAVWLANRWEVFQGRSERTDFFAVLFFGLAVVLGIALSVLGIGRYLHGWDRQSVSGGDAVQGRIVAASGETILVRDDNGKFMTVFFAGGRSAERSTVFKPGKFLQAVGARDPENQSDFYAQRILCCQND